MRQKSVIAICVLNLSYSMVHRWGEDASGSQPEPQQHDQDQWWDENTWDGYAGDDGNESETMNLQELQSSLLEAGYAAAGSRNQHHRHHHHHRHHYPDRGNQGDDADSESGEATTSNRTISESSLPCMNINSSSLSFR